MVAEETVGLGASVGPEEVAAEEVVKAPLQQQIQLPRQHQPGHNGTQQPDIQTTLHLVCARNTGGQVPRRNGVTAHLTVLGSIESCPGKTQIKINETLTSLTIQVYTTPCIPD